MIPVSHNYQQAAYEHRPEILLSLWTTPRGLYLYSNVFPSPAIRNFFGGVTFWDSMTQTLGDGKTWGGLPLCEYGQRIINPGSIKATLTPSRGQLLVSLGQSERGVVSIEYDNSDHYFSALWGDQRNEPFLLQQHELYHGFWGINPEDFVRLPVMETFELRLSREKAIVISTQQSRVAPTIAIGPTLSTYALHSLYVGAETLLLLQSDESDGETTIEDTSPYTWGIGSETDGGVYIQHKTAQSIWGASSLKGDGLSWLSIEDMTATDSHPELLVDFWLYHQAAGDAQGIFALGLIDDTIKMGLFIQSNELLWPYVGYSGSFQAYPIDASGMLTNTWVYVVMTFKQGVFAFYIDGVLLFSTKIVVEAPTSIIFEETTIGVAPLISSEYFQGYIDEFHVANVAVLPSIPVGPYVTADAIMASATYPHATLADVFFASDDWTLTLNFRKYALGASTLFALLNDGTTTTLEIGLTPDNTFFVTTGQAIEGIPEITTYTTSTLAMTADDRGMWRNLFIRYSHTNSEVSFRFNGASEVIAATVPYDRTGTNDEMILVGSEFNGDILNVNFSEKFILTNAQGNNALPLFPEIVRGLNLTLADANWITS